MNVQEIRNALTMAHTRQSKEAMQFLEYFMQNSKPSLLFDTAKTIVNADNAGIRELHYSSQLCKRLVEIVSDENSLVSIRDFALTVVLRCSDSSQRNVRNFFLVIVSWIAIKSTQWKPEMVCTYVNSVLTKDNNLNGLCSFLEFLQTLPEELGNSKTNRLVTKKRKKCISTAFRSEVRQYINILETQIKRFPQSMEIRHRAFEAATSWIEFASLRNVAQVLLYLNCPIMTFASSHLTSSSTKLLTCILNSYTERCDGLAKVCRKQQKVSIEIGDFQSLDRRIEELATPIISVMSSTKSDEFIFHAAEVLTSLLRAGLSRIAFPQQQQQQQQVQRCFTLHTLAVCVLKYTATQDWDTIQNVILPFWSSLTTLVNANVSSIVDLCKMGAVKILNRGFYPVEALRWDVCAVSGEEWFERRNDLRSCFIQISKSLSEKGHKKFFCKILETSTNEIVTLLSTSSSTMTWIHWESAVWRARCVAHTMPNLSGQCLSKILSMYCTKHGDANNIIRMHALLRATFVDGIRLTRTFWSSNKDTMPFALKLSIVGISAASNMNDEMIAKCDGAWFRGEHLDIMRTALVQSASSAGITFDRLCQCASQGKHSLDVSLFSELMSTMSKLVYRSTSGKIPAYSLPAHIRRPVLKGLSALGSSLGKIEEAERSLNVLTADSWRALDVLVSSSDVLNWPLQLLRALGVLEAVMCGDVASMWNRCSSELCARFVSKHWIVIRRVFTALRSIDSKNMMMWLSPLLTRLGNVCTSLLRCVNNTNVAPKVAREFLEFVLSMYNIIADESLLNSATDVVELMGRNISQVLPSLVEAVFPSTSKHLKQGGGPDGAPAVCTSFFKFLNVVCRVCGDSAFETNVLGMANAIINALIVCLQQQPQHRDASSAMLECVQSCTLVISNARSKPHGSSLGMAFFKSLSSSSPERGASLVNALIVAARGGMPSWMIVPVSRTLHSVLISCGSEHFTRWFVSASLSLSINQDRARSMAAQLHKCGSDRSRFKRILKSLSGGKKKGTSGMPSKK